MILIRPSRQLVESYVNINPRKKAVETPKMAKSEWDKDHKEFVLFTFLPKYRPDLDVWRIVAEAYLTKVRLNSGEVKSFEEVLCDGSTFAPDLARRGKIKDPWAMGHDLLYILKKFDLPDAFGRKWKLLEAHDMYKRGWFAEEMRLIGNLWWFGLIIGGWISWNKKFNNIPEPIDAIIEETGVTEIKGYYE